MADRTIEELDEAESLLLISVGGIGRIAYMSRFGPAVLPVNYKWYDGAIVFRTARHSALDEDLQTGITGGDYEVAFEIDEIERGRPPGLERAAPGARAPRRIRGGAREGQGGGRRALGPRGPGAVPADRPAPRHGPPYQACLGLHLDGSAGTFGRAEAAALAVVVVELVLPVAELDDRVVRADTEAVAASEAVAAGHAAARLEQRGRLVEPADHLVERGDQAGPSSPPRPSP